MFSTPRPRLGLRLVYSLPDSDIMVNNYQIIILLYRNTVQRAIPLQIDDWCSKCLHWKKTHSCLQVPLFKLMSQKTEVPVFLQKKTVLLGWPFSNLFVEDFHFSAYLTPQLPINSKCTSSGSSHNKWQALPPLQFTVCPRHLLVKGTVGN